VAKQYILQQVSEEVNRKCRPSNMMVELSITYYKDRQTDRQTDRQYHASSWSYCMQQYDRLKMTFKATEQCG